MAFNTGLSGLRASSVDLDVTGNNIANASTVGFKSSQAQFGDLYASGFLSAGTNPIGDGVRVQDVKQNFGQGNISFTDNGLDLAINGDGFFVLNNGGEVRYSRAGQFGIDKDGFVTNNQNMRVQGFVADDDGNLSGIRGDLQVETDNLAPRRTTNLRSDLNLDSRETVLERRVADMGDYTAPAGATGFPSETFEITYADGSVVSVPINAAGSTDFSAADVVDVLNGQDGLSASATTTYEGMSEADLNAAIAAGNFSFDLAVGGTTVYDSLGNSHEMTQFYVKQPAPGNGVGVSEWSVYLQIDGEFVAGTDQNPYQARFDQDGELQSVNGDPNGEILISDWTPKDADGTPNGADGPPGPGENVTTPIPEPPTTSAFVLDLGNTTQYGSNFGVNDQRQNGYATGRLSGLDVSDQGVLFARYTNGQSQSLGQVALASFNNTNGLSPVGETSWVETFESGQPIIGAPDTGTLGAIKASSIEESNVDLSAELVNLIIAQRNYQANAKTIETSDAVTQTIINLR